jgi:hypothetical protein
MQNIRSGLMPSIYINAHRAKGTQPVTPLDLFGMKQERKPATAAEILAGMTALAKRSEQNG